MTVFFSCFLLSILLIIALVRGDMLDFAGAGTHRLLPEEYAGENLSRSENVSEDSIQGCM